MRLLFSGLWCNHQTPMEAIAEAAKRRGVEVVFSLESREMVEHARRKGLSVEDVWLPLRHRLRGHGPRDEARTIAEFQALSLPRKENLVHYYQKRFGYSRRYSIGLILTYARVLSENIDISRYDAVVNLATFPQQVILMEMFRAQGKPGYFYVGTLAKGFFFLADNFEYRNYFRRLDPKRCDETRVVQLAQQALDQQRKYFRSLYLHTNPIKIARRLFVQTWRDHLRDYLRSYKFNDFIPLKHYLSQQFEQYWVKPFKERYYSQPVDGELFYYFPFGSRAEMNRLFTWPETFYQIDFAVKAASALPPGHLLYVKEHPWYAYPFPVSWIRSLSSHPRVRIIDPRISSYHLQKMSAGVVAFTSDALWEGPFHGKKSAALTPFHSTEFGLNQRIDLAGDVQAQLGGFFERDAPVSRQRVIRYLQAWFSSVYEDRSSRGDGDGIVTAAIDMVEDKHRLDPGPEGPG